jgi:hypothetical protein
VMAGYSELFGRLGRNPQSAALLALVGTVLMTALLLWVFVSNVVNVLRGVDAPVVLFSSFIYAFGCFTLMVFFFGRSGSRDFGEEGSCRYSVGNSTLRALGRRGVLNQTLADIHAGRSPFLPRILFNEQEKPTDQPTPERPQARNTSV